MNFEEYDEQLAEIGSNLCKKLGALQNGLNIKEVMEAQVHLDGFWITMLQLSVGKEALVHYLITLLHRAASQEWQEKSMNAAQLKRFMDIKKEEEELGKT